MLQGIAEKIVYDAVDASLIDSDRTAEHHEGTSHHIFLLERQELIMQCSHGAAKLLLCDDRARHTFFHTQKQ